VRQRRPQELRFDLKMMIGLKRAVVAGADVVQHENDADTCEDWSQQVMRSGEVQRFQSGADDGVAKQFHRDAGLPGYLQSETSERPLKKQLAGPISERFGPRDISGLTASQGFVFSAFRTRRNSNARTFQVEWQMVAGPYSFGHLLGYRSLDEHRAA
jgi:hypothetical protein